MEGPGGAQIDRLIKILITYKKKGQFRAFWNTFNESVNLMASKEVVIESMWSPAVALLIAQGVNVKYAKPPEGMRGWCSCQAIPKHVKGAQLDAVYNYLNWMYNGKPAPRDLPGITGHVGDVKQGQTRDGGSFLVRSCNYSSWNSFFAQNVYQVKRFNDFLSA